MNIVKKYLEEIITDNAFVKRVTVMILKIIFVKNAPIFGMRFILFIFFDSTACFYNSNDN